jgi:site-specific DNA-methyltransferase (adenine-specific)
MGEIDDDFILLKDKKANIKENNKKMNIEINKIYNMDCLDGMRYIPDNFINMILCDLPYKETGNKWDELIDLEKLFKEYKRILKEDGCIALTGSMKFGFKLFTFAEDLYKYDWVWIKDNGTNAPNVPYQPFRIHEFVFIFGKGRVTNGTRIPMKYHPQKTEGKPYRQTSGKISQNWKGTLRNIETNNLTGDRHPLTVQYFNRDKDKIHPTQKPVALFEYLINTYTNKGDLVLDNCIGSGTTAIACIKTERNYIGYEIEKKYFDLCINRINSELLIRKS